MICKIQTIEFGYFIGMAQNQTLLQSFKLPLTRSCLIPLNLGLASFFPSPIWWGCYLWVGLGQTFIISSSLNFLSFSFRDREPEGIFFFFFLVLPLDNMCILWGKRVKITLSIICFPGTLPWYYFVPPMYINKTHRVRCQG